MIQCINKLLFKDKKVPILSQNIEADTYPFFTEMLLFEIADKAVFQDIKGSVKIT